MKQIEIFQMLGDATRLRAMALIAANGELCVCELVAALDLSQPKISRHLTALKNAGLVTSRRDAQWVYHALAADLPKWQQQAIAAALAGVAKEQAVTEDAVRLAEMKDRPARCAA
jgi:ArsR family transcriptional regulator